ncbi:hypothetical protein QE373_003279 [Stenotrophomonas sp. SORGH_AS321]|nr:hypothetical protein [Stenotrophomonas sp. SORGH_AS_0321]
MAMAKLDAEIELSGFEVGAEYTRQEMARLGGLPVPESIRTSQWGTGVLELQNAVLLFVTLQKSSEDDYLDEFEGDIFYWESQRSQRQQSPVIQKIGAGELVPHLFARIRDRQPFVYCGRLGVPLMEGEKPVTCLFEQLDFQKSPKGQLAELYEWRPSHEPQAFAARRERLNAAKSRGTSVNRRSVKYWHVADAVDDLGTPTIAEVGTWLSSRYPEETQSDLRENLAHLTVNSPSRVHYDRARRDWRSDAVPRHPRDRLVRLEGSPIRYQSFDPAIHGHYDLRQGEDKSWYAVALSKDVLGAAEAQGAAEIERHPSPLTDEDDARLWIMKAVAMRKGQGAFRKELLAAYQGRCAISGCTTEHVLEAAHISPYKGEHTNRADNGLLLRSDLHTLFDLGYLWIDEDFRVKFALPLRGADYEAFEGRKLRLPEVAEQRPSAAGLARHAAYAMARAGGRLTPSS